MNGDAVTETKWRTKWSRLLIGFDNRIILESNKLRQSITSNNYKRRSDYRSVGLRNNTVIKLATIRDNQVTGLNFRSRIHVTAWEYSYLPPFLQENSDCCPVTIRNIFLQHPSRFTINESLCCCPSVGELRATVIWFWSSPGTGGKIWGPRSVSVFVCYGGSEKECGVNATHNSYCEKLFNYSWWLDKRISKRCSSPSTLRTWRWKHYDLPKRR